MTTAATCLNCKEMAALLRDAATIIGKVVADNLMPGIAKPAFPAAVLERIETLLSAVRAEPRR